MTFFFAPQAFIFVIFWSVILLAILGGFGATLALALDARKKGRPVWKWGSGAVFMVIVSAVVMVMGYGGYRLSSPEKVFEEVFHVKPPPGTVVLHGSSRSFGDNPIVTLAFRTDRATFDRLRPARLERVSRETYYNHLHNGQSWWKEPSGSGEIWRYRSLDPTDRWSGETIYMTWDPDGLVQYCWESI